MAFLSRIVKAGSGSVETVTFPYLQRANVAVFVDSTPRTFVWDTDTQITLDGGAPGGGEVVEIIRTTPDNLVQFVDGSSLDETLLNTLDLVHQYQNEEFNESERTEVFDMDGNKIVNLADPTLPQDAATKAYVDQELSPVHQASHYAANGTQTITGSLARVAFTIAVHDQGGGYAGNLVTAQKAGVYRISCNILSGSILGLGDRFRVQIRNQGTGVQQAVGFVEGDGVVLKGLSLSCTVIAAIGETFEVVMDRTAGSGNFPVASFPHNTFSAAYIGL
jgi:hypothetical protein